jgi:hypothetical protein
MTIEEIVYAKIIDNLDNQTKSNYGTYLSNKSDAMWKLDRMAREDFLTLLSEAIEDRLQNFSYKIDEQIDKSSQELEHKIRWE